MKNHQTSHHQVIATSPPHLSPRKQPSTCLQLPYNQFHHHLIEPSISFSRPPQISSPPLIPRSSRPHATVTKNSSQKCSSQPFPQTETKRCKKIIIHIYIRKLTLPYVEYRAYKNLSPNTRLGVGVAVIAWGIAGLYISDKAEESFGFTPTEEDKAELRNLAPRITTVEKTKDQPR